MNAYCDVDGVPCGWALHSGWKMSRGQLVLRTLAVLGHGCRRRENESLWPTRERNREAVRLITRSGLASRWIPSGSVSQSSG